MTEATVNAMARGADPAATIADWSDGRLRRQLAKLLADPRCSGDAWEPRDVRHPLIERAVRDGYLRRVDGFCVLTRVPDALVAWTPAGLAALAAEPVAGKDAEAPRRAEVG